MDSLAAWLGAISWPIVSRVLLSAGMGTVTYTGAGAAIDTALSAARTAFTGIGVEIAQLLARAGFFDALAITSGGIVSGLAFMVLKKWALHTTGG